MKKPALLIAFILVAGANIFAQDAGGLTRLTKEDMELLLQDQGYNQLKRISEDPELRKAYIKSIREFLAIASHAQKEGFADTPEAKNEFADMSWAIVAQAYDKEKNKDTAAPFGLVTEKQVADFYQDPQNESAFQAYITEKIKYAKSMERLPADSEPSKEQIGQVKDSYAKMMIYAKEAGEQKATLGPDFWRKVELQTKLQQSQYLVQAYSQKVLEPKVKVKVTDKEIAEYIGAHPELSLKAKKAKALALLRRVKAGANFARLADRTSDDPGTKGNGGLYKDVAKGLMVLEFERAALALKPGRLSSQLVETRYGYHIIKLERKGKGIDPSGNRTETYDVRHILVSTMIKDEANPNSPGTTITDYVSGKIDAARQQKAIDEIAANNPVEVAEDFVIKLPPAPPAVTVPDESLPALGSEGNADPVTKAKPASAPKTRPKKRRP